ncbi:MAG: hypothetical protein KGL39_13900 [Patescibacteria group bacterium]|nr:hypothetical protein [Patescibacteria group bacterium]
MGKIKSVTNANVAEYVADRKVLGSESKEQLALEVNPEVKAEKSEAPVPAVEPKSEPKAEAKGEPKEGGDKPKNSVQDRIDELVRQRKELDEFAEGEYQARLQAQHRIAELEQQIQSVQKVVPEVKEDLEPDPGTFTDQKEFLKAWGDWNRKKAISEFQASERKRREEEERERQIQQANARRQKSLEEARKVLPDFDEVIRAADRSAEAKSIPAPTPIIAGLLAESDYQAHLLYHLAKSPEEMKNLNAMRPAQAALFLGRLETQFAKAGIPAQAAPTIESPKPNLPEPTPALGIGGGNVPVDLNAPMQFADYKRRRLDEIRMKRARK